MDTVVRHFCILLLPLALGCKNVEAAPEDLDGLFRWFVANQHLGDAEAIDEATGQYDGLAGARVGAPDADPERGSISDLLAADIELLGLPEATDPELAAGFYLLDAFDCTIDELEPVLYELDQASQYEGWYDRYERTYTSDFDAYIARETDALSWDIDIDATLIGSVFHEQMSGSFRRIETVNHGPVLLQLTWMTAPATFETGQKEYKQDYQMELYYTSEPGRISHMYALWREVNIPSVGITAESDGFVNTVLNNLEDWDETTGKLCRGEL